MNEETCGCCEGLEILTPQTSANRPGLDTLNYRVGTHATFLETMKARLSSGDFSALAELRTRDSSDPSIALLDAWAIVADVLTFYQERIANEGYLRTATERRSILELSRLVGYDLRPGVAATVYPAFTMEAGYNEGSEIPKGTRIQSIPGPGEMPQFFETGEKIEARADWNELKPRRNRPQQIRTHTIKATGRTEIKNEAVYFKGISTNLKANDALLFVIGKESNQQLLCRVKMVELQAAENRTKVTLQSQELLSQQQSEDHYNGENGQNGSAFKKLGGVIEQLSIPPSLQPANNLRLPREAKQAFAPQSDVAPRLLTTLKPSLGPFLYKAWDNLQVTEPSQVKVYALRARAAPFGHNAPLRPDRYDERRKMVVYDEWDINNPLNQTLEAKFVPSRIEGSAPLTVQFTDRSVGNIESYQWKVEDDVISTKQNPQPYTFEEAKTYTVTLTVSGPLGTNTTSPVTIVVTAPGSISAAFSTNPDPPNVSVDTSIEFTDESTGNITSRRWNFGDGQTSTDQELTHQFTEAGSYTVILTVLGTVGSSTARTTVNVYPVIT